MRTQTNEAADLLAALAREVADLRTIAATSYALPVDRAVLELAAARDRAAQMVAGARVAYDELNRTLIRAQIEQRNAERQTGWESNSDGELIDAALDEVLEADDLEALNDEMERRGIPATEVHDHAAGLHDETRHGDCPVCEEAFA